ncbi:MAG: cofactor-independent phosphoglycerate mutase [Deltaproteobacteria bacterium]|nr:cofactor-independent phosphoglycerate mutase [Deltaproteobacteria bacterium]
MDKDEVLVNSYTHRKVIILIGDGMGDYPIAELAHRTPLEAAHTPAMDYIASHGVLGELLTVPQGFPPGSDVANLSLLGYRPEEVYTGRSPLEAASLGVDLEDGEIAFRCNLVTLEGNESSLKMVDYSGGHISTDEARELINALASRLNGDNLKLYPGISYRHLLVYRNDVSGLKTAPPHDYTGKDVTNFWQEYKHVPELMSFMEKSRKILKDHPVNRQRQANGRLPANGTWLWGEGKAPDMMTLKEKYGLSGSLISAVDLLKGIGVYAGMDIVDVPGATGYLDTNYQGKVDAALHAIGSKDIVVVHVEAPDETGHQGDLKNKIRAIQEFDQNIVQPILNGIPKETDCRIVVCMDHFTPIHLRTHTSDAVPVAVYDSDSKNNNTSLTYNEKNGKSAELKFKNGEEFFQYIIGEF